MDLEEITVNGYRNEDTISFDRTYNHLLNLDRKPILYYGKMEFEKVASAILRRSREFGFFVGVSREYLEREAGMSQSTYELMHNTHNYLSHKAGINDVEIIYPTEKMLINKTTMMEKM
jgi:hypothetical protein